ncbi:MAG TPA: glycoside hydrolase family 25, partial [Verrucomicrobiae bacterium]|nr:glycoside hydrolase family 25 [Verrucomicrobiae bacterium]
CDLNSSITLTPWIADWNGENLYSGNPWSTCTSCQEWGAGVWTFWQASDSGRIKGITGKVDLDTFNGTLAQLVASQGL